MSDDRKALNAALLEAQKQIGAVTKDANNKFFSSDYATLEAVLGTIKDALNGAGIVILQPVEMIGESWCVVSRLLHAESGQSIESIMPVVCKDMNDPQKWGSAITYARRYTLQSLVALPSAEKDDDDGNGASGKTDKKTAPQKPTAPSKKESDSVKEIAKRAAWNAAKKAGIVSVNTDKPKLQEYAIANGINVPLDDMTSAELNELEGKIVTEFETKKD